MSENIDKFSYLSIKEIAERTGIGIRTLRNYCKTGRCTFRKTAAKGGKNGLKYEILVSSLKKELQDDLLILLDNSFCRRDENKIPNTAVPSAFSLFNKPNPAARSNIDSPLMSYGAQNASGFDTSSKQVFGSFCTKSSPTSAAENFNNQANHNLTFLNGGADKTPPVGSSAFSFAPQKAKEIALAKFTLTSSWLDYRRGKKDKKQADKEFLLMISSGIYHKNERKLLGKVSIRSLYRWEKILKNNNNNYYSLINEYRYASENSLITSLTEEEKQDFITLYYNDSKYNLSTVYNILRYKAEKTGLEIKSESTYRRFAKFIERNHKDFELLSRNGEKALNDYAVPPIRRDTSKLEVGDILVADGNKLDFMIINPFTGKPSRATMVVFMDWASHDFLGYEIMFSENTQCIASALRNAIIRLGKFPKVVYMDNGRAFRSKYFNGTESLEPLKGIYAQLGIKTCFATAYNGKAKIVERAFGEFVKSCPPAVSSYTGSSIANKPAYLMRNEKFQKGLHRNDTVPTIQEAKQVIDKWLEYYRSKQLKNGKTINEMFEMGKGSGVNIDLLDELMMSSERRNVKRSTIHIFDNDYTADELYGLDKEIIVKYSLFDISKIKVYTLRGEYICEAQPVRKYNPMAKYFGDANDIYSLKQAQKYQKSLIKSTKNKTKRLLGEFGSFKNTPWSSSNIIPMKNKKEISEKQSKKRLNIDFTANYEDLAALGLKKTAGYDDFS